MKKTIASAMFGCVIGIGMVLACSDDSPSTADAAECNCPEPSLTDRIVREPATSVTLAPGSTDSQGRGCSTEGAILLSGSCRLQDAPSADLILIESGLSQDGTVWSCKWRNNGGLENTGLIVTTCLNPPAQ